MYIKVRVTPGAKKELVTEIAKNRFAIAVKEPAENNLANRRVLELVAEQFSVRVAQVRLVSGHRSQSKIFSIPD